MRFTVQPNESFRTKHKQIIDLELLRHDKKMRECLIEVSTTSITSLLDFVDHIENANVIDIKEFSSVKFITDMEYWYLDLTGDDSYDVVNVNMRLKITFMRLLEYEYGLNCDMQMGLDFNVKMERKIEIRNLISMIKKILTSMLYFEEDYVIIADL